MQFPFGWLEWNKKKLPVESFFTKESLQEVISASHEVFGATTVILQTVPLLNNVKDMKDQLMVINSVIYEVANQYVPSKENGVQKVLVMDLAWLSFNLFAHNAVGLGVSNPSILEKLNGRDGSGKKGRAAKLVVDELNPLLGQRHDCCHAEVKEIVPFGEYFLHHLCELFATAPRRRRANYAKMTLFSVWRVGGIQHKILSTKCFQL